MKCPGCGKTFDVGDARSEFDAYDDADCGGRHTRERGRGGQSGALRLVGPRNGDELVVDAVGNSTSCRVARAVGDAYLARPGWYPYHLRAIGRRWTRTQHEYGGSSWRYRVIQYEARDRRGKWLSVHLTYQW